jgi:hypothetical protein
MHKEAPVAVTRVRSDLLPCGVLDPETQTPVRLAPGLEFDSSDPIVRAFPWAFATVESATAKPGEKRNVRRPRGVATMDPDVAKVAAR